GGAFGDLAEEAQGDVEGLDRPPPGPRQPLLAADQPFADLGRNGDGREQADHRRALGARPPSALATIGARRPAITFAPAALGWMPSACRRPGPTPAIRSA